jgi:hypothetical protein
MTASDTPTAPTGLSYNEIREAWTQPSYSPCIADCLRHARGGIGGRRRQTQPRRREHSCAARYAASDSRFYTWRGDWCSLVLGAPSE